MVVNAVEAYDSESKRILLEGSWEPVALRGGWLQVARVAGKRSGLRLKMPLIWIFVKGCGVLH